MNKTKTEERWKQPPGGGKTRNHYKDETNPCGSPPAKYTSMKTTYQERARQKAITKMKPTPVDPLLHCLHKNRTNRNTQQAKTWHPQEMIVLHAKAARWKQIDVNGRMILNNTYMSTLRKRLLLLYRENKNKTKTEQRWKQPLGGGKTRNHYKDETNPRGSPPVK